MIRVVQNMPEWTPVSIDGNNVRAYKSITVNYDPAAIIPGTITSDGVYEMIDETIKGNSKPTFPGGDAALFHWLSQNIKYPAICRENNKQGRVLVGFIIEKDGSFSAPMIKKSSGDELLDSEALRVILNMPRWNPAMINDKSVRCSYELPTTFKLEG
jgi:protein TonB